MLRNPPWDRSFPALSPAHSSELNFVRGFGVFKIYLAGLVGRGIVFQKNNLAFAHRRALRIQVVFRAVMLDSGREKAVQAERRREKGSQVEGRRERLEPKNKASNRAFLDSPERNPRKKTSLFGDVFFL